MEKLVLDVKTMRKGRVLLLIVVAFIAVVSVLVLVIYRNVTVTTPTNIAALPTNATANISAKTGSELLAPGDWVTTKNAAYDYALRHPASYVVEYKEANTLALASSKECLTKKQALPSAYDQPINLPGCHFLTIYVQGNKLEKEGTGVTMMTAKLGTRDAEKIKAIDGATGTLTYQAEVDDIWYILDDAFSTKDADAVEAELDVVAVTFQITDVAAPSTTNTSSENGGK